jgi:hypothetical protein
VILGDLIVELKLILEVHPEAEEFTVWGCSTESGHNFQVKAVGLDSKHKPKRVKMYD